jgi:hypothetical protein
MTRIRSVHRHVLAVASLVAGVACASNPPNPDHDRDRDNNRVSDSHGDVVNQRRDDAGRYAHQAPPADRSETPPAQPGPQYVWVAGHYSWDGNDFQWHSGAWAQPPNGYHTWAPGAWQQTGTANWVYVEGQWQ